MDQMLTGIRVIDMTNNFAGPAAAATMADYGAEVIHIEKPGTGDDSRGFLPFRDGVSLNYCSYNRGKKSVVLDLKDPVGNRLLREMIRDADVLIESFRPGVMDRLGLGYEEAAKLNPKLIYCSVSAFGHKGPYRSKPGYDVIAQAYSGFMHKTGEKDGPPMMTGVAIGDAVSALNAYGSIMTALLYRERTGRGQHVDIALCRTLLWCNTFFDYINSGVDSCRAGNCNDGLSPYGLYQGQNGSVVIACISEILWEKLCCVMDKKELIEDPRTKTLAARVENRAFVDASITDWIMGFEQIEQAIEELEKAGIPNAKVNSHTDLLNDPHARQCGWILDVPAGNGLGDQMYVTRGVLADFSAAPGDARHPASTLGEHNEEVLTQYGLTREEVKALTDRWTR